jgi:hypothetical protein
MTLKQRGHEGVEWIHLAQDMEQWQSLVKTSMRHRAPQNGGEFLD